MHRRTIPTVDFSTGEISQRASDTLTVDIPADFDRAAGEISVDGRDTAHYLSLDGKRLSYHTHFRPLSWRVRGEQCLIMRKGAGLDDANFKLCIVDPIPQ
jgi:hypothetical protein